MISCAEEMTTFHDDEVRLKQNQILALREKRNTNRKRLQKGQEKNIKPVPADSDFVIQGSYAMHTQIQAENNDFDIDDGVIFDKESLKGSQEGDMIPLDARKMIKNALEADDNAPEIELKTNCVRVRYATGYHIDIPVYRCYEGADGEIVQEIASSTWKESDPKAVTQWYNNAVTEMSHSDNPHQLRRITRLLKAFAKSRTTWSNPAGLILSALIIETGNFMPVLGKDDESLRRTCERIRDRLEWRGLEVDHPIVQEKLVESNDPKVRNLRDHLKAELEKLNELDYAGCTKSRALELWSGFFNTDFFKNKVEEDNEKAATAVLTNTGVPTKPPTKGGSNHYA